MALAGIVADIAGGQGRVGAALGEAAQVVVVKDLSGASGGQPDSRRSVAPLDARTMRVARPAIPANAAIVFQRDRLDPSPGVVHEALNRAVAGKPPKLRQRVGNAAGAVHEPGAEADLTVAMPVPARPLVVGFDRSGYVVAGPHRGIQQALIRCGLIQAQQKDHAAG